MKLFARKKDVEAKKALEAEIAELEKGINYYYGEADKFRAQANDLSADLQFLNEFSPEWNGKCSQVMDAKHKAEMYDQMGNDLHNRADALRNELQNY